MYIPFVQDAVLHVVHKRPTKYSGLVDNYSLCPLAFGTLGGPYPITTAVLYPTDSLPDRREAIIGELRTGSFMFQRLLLDNPRANVMAVTGNMRA